MTVLIRDRQTTFFVGELAEHRVAVDTQIFLGALTSLNSAGLAIPANSTTADQTFVGVSAVAADNRDITPTARRQLDIECRRTGIHVFNSTSALDRDDIGASVFVVDDQTVSLIQATNAPFVGQLAKFQATNLAHVDITGGLNPKIQPAVIAQQTFAASCTASELVGNFVRTSAAGAVRNVDITDAATMATVGVIISKASTVTCTVQPAGIVSGLYAGLTPGANLFLDTAAQLSETFSNPVSGVRWIQIVATALTANDILVGIRPPIGVLPL